MYKKMMTILPFGFIDDLNVITNCGDDSKYFNIFLNTKIELKKLKFHTPKSNGASKCQKMHVGKPSIACPELNVHGHAMQEMLVK